MSTLDDLLAPIFEGNPPFFYPEFEGWVKSSRRFKSFVSSNSGKIRAKLRNVRDEGGMKDFRAELETAMLLLREERFTLLEYEKYAAAKQRGPDFTVTFKTHTPFNVEVRRFRSLELADEDNSEARINKLMTILCDKVGQMPPSIVNVLWLIAERNLSEDELVRAVSALRLLAERKNEEFFTKRGFPNAAGFLKQYSHLSAIVLRRPEPNHTLVWLNPQARHKTPLEIVTVLQRL
jgi:hypothetical protein